MNDLIPQELRSAKPEQTLNIRQHNLYDLVKHCLLTNAKTRTILLFLQSIDHLNKTNALYSKSLRTNKSFTSLNENEVL